MIRTIPLNKLICSPRNVRRAVDEQADRELKADIEARGLLQNLLVSPASKPKGFFEVEAGGRRLRALQALAKDRKLAKSHGVNCLIIEGGPAEAQEASLAENFQQLAMNPADECLAFQQLIDRGSDADAIARRFGVTMRFVEGRLRLAGLAPAIFEALGAGEIGIDIAKAYAATPDQERQAFVFEQIGKGYAHPDSIRRMMTQATASASDRRALFVGEDAYLEAGGRIERDLFADDSAARWLDVAILERLAGEKMDALAGATAAETGLGWVRPTLNPWVGYSDTEELSRVHLEAQLLSDEEKADIEAKEAEIGRLIVMLQEDEPGADERGEAEARIRSLDEEIDSIANKPPLVPEDLKPQIGAFLVLDDEGRPKLDGAYYRVTSPDDEASPAAGDGSASRPRKAARPAGLTQRHVDELAMQRRDILAVHVAADPGLALDLATFLMIDRESGCPFERSGFSLSAHLPSDPAVGFKTPDAPATAARREAVDALDRSWIDGESIAERFDAFRALPDEARAAWLGHAVARTVEASLNLAGPRACAFHDHLGNLLGIDVARWWRPSGANYFDRVPKSAALAALADVGGGEFSGRYAGSKKAELSQSCERIFAGDFIGEADMKDAARAWLPEVMRFAPRLLVPLEEGEEGGDAKGDRSEVGADAGNSISTGPAADQMEEAA